MNSEPKFPSFDKQYKVMDTAYEVGEWNHFFRTERSCICNFLE